MLSKTIKLGYICIERQEYMAPGVSKLRIKIGRKIMEPLSAYFMFHTYTYVVRLPNRNVCPAVIVRTG